MKGVADLCGAFCGCLCEFLDWTCSGRHYGVLGKEERRKDVCDQWDVYDSTTSS